MTREIIAQRIMQCTPRELQHALTVIHSWEQDFGDELAKNVKTVQDIIDLLSLPEYTEEIEAINNESGQDYFEIILGI